jgi:cysteine-rich repeat protein
LDAEDGCVDGAIVAGFACPAAGIPCEPIYGDGMVVGDEECDDGNTDAADGCAGNSTVEDGWTCDAAEPSVCSVVYGDGYVVAGEEQCDDGNTEAGDGCSANGEVEPGYTCNGGNLVTGGAPSICKVVYGDGYVVGGVE